MKLISMCSECIQQKEINSIIQEVEFKQELSDKYDIDIFTIENVCPNGHHSYSMLQAFAFEVLFDFAVRCLVKEDYESAIVYFSSAKERFYWFFVRYASRKLNHNNSATQYFHKIVRKSSQQEEGVFYAIYSLYFNEIPKVFETRTQEIRNNVVHRGQFVGKDDCIKYGKEVFNKIVDILGKVKEKDPDFYFDELTARKKELSKVSEFESKKYTIISGECANFMINGDKKIDFDEIVERCKTRDKMITEYYENIKKGKS